MDEAATSVRTRSAAARFSQQSRLWQRRVNIQIRISGFRYSRECRASVAPHHLWYAIVASSMDPDLRRDDFSSLRRDDFSSLRRDDPRLTKPLPRPSASAQTAPRTAAPSHPRRSASSHQPQASHDLPTSSPRHRCRTES